MTAIEDQVEELGTLSTEILKQLDKLPITHGEARVKVDCSFNQQKYNFIKDRLAYGKNVLRRLKLEIRGLPEEKQQKWKEV